MLSYTVAMLLSLLLFAHRVNFGNDGGEKLLEQIKNIIMID